MSREPLKPTAITLLKTTFPSTDTEVAKNLLNKKKKGVGYKKYCGVCGDLTVSYHFGGLCCNSCKSFFRRSIENDSFLGFYCAHQGRCVISISNRRDCRYCRMNRCLAIGMSKDWHLGDIASSDTPRHFSPKLRRPEFEIAKSNFLTPPDMRAMEAVLRNYNKAIANVETRCSRDYTSDPLAKNTDMKSNEIFGPIVKRFYNSIYCLPEFASLPFQDQMNLLKSSVLEMSILRLTLTFDPLKKSWTSTTMPNTGVCHLDHLTRSPVASQMTAELMSGLQQLRVDELTIMLLSLIVLFTPERSSLIRRQGIEKCQIHFALLLKHYTVRRDDEARSKITYAKLLTKLNDLRELGELNDLQHLRDESERILANLMQNQQISGFSSSSSPKITFSRKAAVNSIPSYSDLSVNPCYLNHGKTADVLSNIANSSTSFRSESAKDAAFIDPDLGVDLLSSLEKLICVDDVEFGDEILQTTANPGNSTVDLFQLLEEFLEHCD